MVEYPIPPIRARRDDTSGSGRSHRRDPPDQHRQRTEPLLAFPEMETLTQMKCVACRKDAPTVTDAEIAEFQPQVSAPTSAPLPHPYARHCLIAITGNPAREPNCDVPAPARSRVICTPLSRVLVLTY